ncbi:MAG TPA: nuclear transport factor 2 family protein [Gemmatimonadaceae bacterium]|nr:nuclear transport factor 2 family protein [Gemmatimonadaceae bacterium]
MRRGHANALLVRLAYISRRFPITLLFVISAISPAPTYAQSQTTARHAGDTLPDHIARRALEAYNRHDVPALLSFYDTVFVHEMLGDSTGRFKGTPDQTYAGLADYFAKNKVSAELKQQMVSGPLVVQLYDFIENGKRTPHIEVVEVRHGKIVHDWDQGP